MNDEYLPSLYGNGALDPDNWDPDLGNLRGGVVGTVPEVGDLVGWRYGAWRVVESAPVAEADLSDEDKEGLRIWKPTVRARMWPRAVVLRHESGPLILKPGEPSQRLHDGGRTVHFRTPADGRRGFHVLRDPYKTCSCHGHIWPCQEYDQAVLAKHHARKMDRLMATTQPGVCANCLEPISTRQKTVTFPEESRWVPGAPGPTFHAGRSVCWAAAEEYERTGRLVDNPDVPRLASCPGVRFIHEARSLPADRRLDCTAGPFCTGHHGPPGYRQDAPCWYRINLAANEGAYARPTFDCGYRQPDRACLGGDLSGGGTSISPIAADLIWENRRRARGLGGGG